MIRRKKNIKKFSIRKKSKVLILLNHIIGVEGMSIEDGNAHISNCKNIISTYKENEKGNNIIHYVTLDDKFRGIKLELLYPPINTTLNESEIYTLHKLNRIKKIYSTIEL